MKRIRTEETAAESRDREFEYRWGVRLEQLRMAKKMSRADLGKLIGVHRNTIIHWESGDSAPTVLQTEKLRIYLGRLPEVVLELVCEPEVNTCA